MIVSQRINSIFLKLPIQSWLLILILISLPLKHIINSIFVIVFTLFTVSQFIIKKKKKDKLNPVLVLCLALFLWMVSSLIWSLDFEVSLNSLSQFLSFLALPIAFYYSDKSKFDVKKILQFFSYIMTIYAIVAIVIGLIKYFYSGNSIYLFYHTLSSPFDDINAIYFSVFVAFALFFISTELNKSKINQLIFIILSVFLILLSSKMIVICTTFILLIRIIINYRIIRLGILKRVIILVVIVASILTFSKNIMGRINIEIEKTNYGEVLEKSEFGQVYHWTGTGLRLFQLRMFFELMGEDQKHVLGYGLHASQDKLDKKYKAYNLYPGFYSYNFHNQYAQITSELGIIGLFLLLSILGFSFKQAVVNKNFLFLSFLVLITFTFFTESFLWRQRGMVFFITLVLLFNLTFKNLLKNNS